VVVHHHYQPTNHVKVTSVAAINHLQR
jgi:hypothetical protein